MVQEGANLQSDAGAVLALIAQRRLRGRRFVLAIAGPPGAGKSTLAEAVTDALNRDDAQTAALLPMDGFHLDNRLLDARGLRARKGAPETFDSAGFAATLARIRANEDDVIHPVFDRTRDIAIAGAGLVAAGSQPDVIVVEGNYLLLDNAPWNRLAESFDATVFLAPPVEELERRLVQRWVDHGHEPQAARARALGNDIPTALLVLEKSRPADLILGARPERAVF